MERRKYLRKANTFKALKGKKEGREKNKRQEKDIVTEQPLFTKARSTKLFIIFITAANLCRFA